MQKINQEQMRQEERNWVSKRPPLTSDYVFKRVFAKDENNSMLKDFLEAILDKKINKVIVKNPEIPKSFFDERMGILDLKVEVDGSEIIDVEMQIRNEHNIGKRSSVYLSKIVAEQLKTGERYESVKKGIVINLLNFEYFKRNSYHSIARMKFDETLQEKYVDMGYEQEDKIATDVFEMHFIELPKFIKKNPEGKTKLEQWLWLLAGGKEEKIKMVSEENEEVKKVVELLDKLGFSDDEKVMREYREKAEWDYNDAMAYLSEKAQKEGMKQGIKEANLQNAKKMLEENIAEETIMKITGLSKEELEELKDRKSVV